MEGQNPQIINLRETDCTKKHPICIGSNLSNTPAVERWLKLVKH